MLAWHFSRKQQQLLYGFREIFPWGPNIFLIIHCSDWLLNWLLSLGLSLWNTSAWRCQTQYNDVDVMSPRSGIVDNWHLTVWQKVKNSLCAKKQICNDMTTVWFIVRFMHNTSQSFEIPSMLWKEWYNRGVLVKGMPKRMQTKQTF